MTVGLETRVRLSGVIADLACSLSTMIPVRGRVRNSLRHLQSAAPKINSIDADA